MVWLEKCMKGNKDHDVRAVKEIAVSVGNRRVEYNRELEAIAKFSHRRVCPILLRCRVQSPILT
jgi:hypothetical protein